MHPDLVLLSTLIVSNYPCLELILMVVKVFEPLKFDCSKKSTYIYLTKETALESKKPRHILKLTAGLGNLQTVTAYLPLVTVAL